MKIAVTYENGEIFPHFGRTERFKIYETDNEKVLSSRVVSTDGKGHGELVGFLVGYGVNVLICGGIGGGAQEALQEAGIVLYGGVSGGADEAVEALLGGRLGFDPDVHCDHHGHGEKEKEGSCGSHGCGKLPKN